MFNKNNKRVLVIGSGKSGIAVANLLKKKEFKVYISDIKNKNEIPELKKLDKGIIFINEKEAEKKLENFDFFVKSPGIKNENTLIKKIKANKKNIYSEIDISLAFSKSKNIIAITGTNGKTTTTTLTYLIMNNFLSKNGRKAILCGNIGKPAAEELQKANKNDWIVMELSSYQLEDSLPIKPYISVILNITPDHIEHHGSMQKYINAKAKIFKNQNKENFCILNYDDKYLKKLYNKIPSKILYFSSLNKNKKLNAFYDKGKIYIKFKNKKYKLIPPDIPGLHNIENAMASALAAISANVDIKTIQNTFNKFKGIEHRIEFIKEINGVKYINDSKATNVDSTLVALKALGKKKNIWLILGGLDKGSPYKPIIHLAKKYVKKILTIGSAAQKIEKELKNYVDIISAKDLKNAINIIKNNAIKGDTALLSPACASYDQFKNFEERGKKFKEFVLQLE